MTLLCFLMDAHFKIILAMLSIHFIFSGLNTFIGNQGYEGTAMYLCVNETTNIQYTGSRIYFVSNEAEYTGGAIQIVGVNSENPRCPFNHIMSGPTIGYNSNVGELTFIGNVAYSAGDDIYGGYLDQALVNEGNNITRCIDVIRQSSDFLDTSDWSSISSKPSRVCLCNKHKPDCMQVFLLKDAYPGEDMPIEAVAVGQGFGTSSGFVYAQLLKIDFIPRKLGCQSTQL